MKCYRFRILLIALLCVTGFYGNAQAPTWVWAQNNNVPYGAVGLVTDAAGNVYTAGLTFAKRSPSGMLLWSHQLVSPNQDAEATGLARDAAGNLYLCGYFNATIQLDTISLTSSGRKDIFVAKFKPNGKILWARKAGGPGPPPSGAMPGYIDDGAFAVATDSIGNCFIVGGYHNLGTTVWFDSISIPPATPTNIGRVFVAKYNTTGKIQWVQPINGPEIYDISLGPQGTYYVAQRDSGIKISKFNANRTLAWVKTSSNNPDAWNLGLCTDKAGNCYITGSFNGSLIFDSDTLSAPANLSNVYLIKYGSNGNVQWARQNKGGKGTGEFVTTDDYGDIYVTGGLSGAVSFGFGIQVTAAYGSTDIFAAKYDASGTVQWATVAGGGGGDYGQAIGALPNGDCYVAGQFNGFSTFGSVSLPGTSTYNFFVAKLAANPLGISKNQTATNFQLYPNPSNSEVTIFNPDLRNPALKVYNTAGQIVYETKNLEKGSLKIATENWPVGIYAVRISANGKTFTQKLIVSH